MALAAFAVALVPLLRRGEPPVPMFTKVPASAGIGALGFSFFRVTLHALFADRLIWFEFWEEATELAFVLGILFVLWQFRTSLLAKTATLETLRLMLPLASRERGQGEVGVT
jgi:hypothetical protein